MVTSNFSALTSRYFSSEVMTCTAFQSVENSGLRLANPTISQDYSDSVLVANKTIQNNMV